MREVWTHIHLGMIYDPHGQRDRAVNEYNHAGACRKKAPYERKRSNI